MFVNLCRYFDLLELINDKRKNLFQWEVNLVLGEEKKIDNSSSRLSFKPLDFI